ncbi:MAG: TlpA family protein disulfide reductase [Betaproteobacteria bacterium]|nr:TlpA family protein disulfide reductase [Betaproteobacteria bacterium]
MNNELTGDSKSHLLQRRGLMAGVALLSALGGYGLWRLSQPEQLDADTEKKLWSSVFDTPDGSSLSLQDLKGKPLVINFWATWCAPCVEEMPLINAFYQQKKSKSWQVVGLAIDQPSSVKNFLSQYPVEYLVGLAGLEGTELAKNLGNLAGGLPFTVVLNANGSILAKKLGKLNTNDIKNWV